MCSRFNRPGGLGVFYAGVGSPTGNVTRVYNLGNLYEPANRPNIPVNNTYAIDAGGSIRVNVLQAMGFDLASIHAAGSPGAATLRADLKKRPRDWLNTAAKTAVAAVRRDFEEWRN